MKKRQLLKKYRNDLQSWEYFQIISALPFLPPNLVKRGFDAASESIPDGWESFTEYVERTYIRGNQGQSGRYKIRMWNVYDRVKNDLPRTNNSLEGWHRGVNKMLNISRPSIWRLLKFIKTELDRQSVRYNNVIRSSEKQKRRKEQIKDENIKNLVLKFKPTNDKQKLRDYLFNISLEFI